MSAGNTDPDRNADILVVDDTVANLQLLSEVLGRAGYRVRPAGTGELALRSAQAKVPALILLDIRMPGMDGLEVCRRLKANEITRDVPVIFLTALSEATEKAEGFALGAVDYITKPFSTEEVLARVRLHLALAEASARLAAQNLQLQEINGRLEGIYRTVGNGIISVDEKQRIVLFNFAAERIFGYPVADMIGQPLSVLLPERFHKQHEVHLHAFGDSGQSARKMGVYGMIYALRAGGEEFPIEATVSQSGVSPNRLFTVILNDITERRLSEAERERLLKQLQLLSERLAAAQEEERRRIALELHEELGQELATLRLYLMTLRPNGSPEKLSPFEAALTMTAQALERIRTMTMSISPPALEDLGLQAAVRNYCRDEAAKAGWTLHIDAQNSEPRLPRSVERLCFRLLQEALANVLHHANAREVWVLVRQSGDQLELVVRDDGIGFDLHAVRGDAQEIGGLGLFEMQVRASRAGGSVEIKSNPGAGTEIRAVFPLADRA